MKSKYKKPEVSTYNLSQFVRKYPDFKRFLPCSLDVSDTRYIIRFCGNRFEVGYPSDEWRIK